MVFVTMGDEQGFDLAPVVFEIGVIGDDVVDARKGRFGETNAGIDQDDRALGFKTIGVFANLA
jgi:hypothetical protein